jgi:hypothetical protein
MTRMLPMFAVLAVLLGVVAAVSPKPKPLFVTDEDLFENTARRFIVADCSDLQCSRLLASWIVGRLPGQPVVRWKVYAVVSIAAAAVALGSLCLAAGLSLRAAQFAMWLVAFGFGPLLTMHNPFSPDPLMYFAGPLVMTALWRGRHTQATFLAAIGVFGKEVAAAPLWIQWLSSMLRRDWSRAARLLAMALGVTLLWVFLQLWLMIAFNYSYGGSKSVDLLHGGDLVVWWSEMGVGPGLKAIFASFGALFLLMPIGFARANRELRLLAIAVLPAALVLCYVQQPDRAIWNFHYALIPLAVLVLERLPDVGCWAFIVCYALANLRIGAQLQFIPASRYSLLVSVLIAAAAIVASVRRPRLAAGAAAGEPAV